MVFNICAHRNLTWSCQSCEKKSNHLSEADMAEPFIISSACRVIVTYKYCIFPPVLVKSTICITVQ